MVVSDTSSVLIFTHTKLSLSSCEIGPLFETLSDNEMDDLLYVRKDELLPLLRKLGNYKIPIAKHIEESKYLQNLEY